MKVVQINCTYAQGSTGKIVAELHRFLKEQGAEAKVIYGTGNEHRDPDIVRAAPEAVRKLQSLRARLTGYAYGGCLVGTHNIIRFLKREQPDIVHIHCINAYMVNICRLLTYLKKAKVKTVVTLHAEFLYTTGCSYAVDCDKWLTGCHHCERIGRERPASWLFDRTRSEWKCFRRAYAGTENMVVCGVSEWVSDRARLSPFYQENQIPVTTVYNGVNTATFYPHGARELREALGLTGEKVVLHVTPGFGNVLKGGMHVVEQARRFRDRGIRFLVVGCAGVDFETPDNLTFLGRTADQDELARYYSMADLCLLTSVRETFSMVCAESLCCGTPVVGFRAGAPELISLAEYSEFVEQGNDDALEKAIAEWLAAPAPDPAGIARKAGRRYAETVMCENYCRIYNGILAR